MRILLPPSETKRPGGGGRPLDLAALALPELLSEREQATDALVALSADIERARRILKLSDRQLGEVEDNARLRAAPTMAAVDRYTGVLYEALAAASLDPAARRWLGQHVWIQTAPWGPVGSLDRIPAYRLAAGTALPGIPPLRRHWADATSRALATAGPAFVLDLRSDAYVALGPVPVSLPSAYVRVVTREGKALNHFNKKTKGLLVRALANDRPRVRSAGDLLAWAANSGVGLRSSAEPGVLDLVAVA